MICITRGKKIEINSGTQSTNTTFEELLWVKQPSIVKYTNVIRLFRREHAKIVVR